MTEKPPINKILPLKRVLLVEDNPVRSSPILSLAAEFDRLGIETVLSGDSLWSSTRKWMALALRSQVLVFVVFPDGDSPFFRRQMLRARLLGCVVVRWWVGSDVLYSQESEESASRAKALDEAVDLNIAVSPHLVEELAEIGIDAEYLPSLCDLTTALSDTPSRLPRGVLTYLPANRKAFYGEKVLIAAIEANPDLKFFIVSDHSHSLRHYPNVESLGWVEDMGTVWPEVGLLLRVTEHDGMPRMVLEALARSRYVIYSEVFEGCWFGRSTEEVQKHLELFKSLDVPNIAGPQVVQGVGENAASMYVERMAALRASAPSARALLGTLFRADWIR